MVLSQHWSDFLVIYPWWSAHRCPSWRISNPVNRFDILRYKPGRPDTCVETTLLVLRGIDAINRFAQDLGRLRCNKCKRMWITSRIIQQSSEFCWNFFSAIVIFSGTSYIEWWNATNRRQIQNRSSAILPKVEWNIDANHAEDDRIKICGWWWR